MADPCSDEQRRGPIFVLHLGVGARPEQGDGSFGVSPTCGAVKRVAPSLRREANSSEVRAFASAPAFCTAVTASARLSFAAR